MHNSNAIMKIFAAFLAVASASSASAASLPSQSTPMVDVQLQLQQASTIKAIVTNNGATDINVVKLGSILDDSPVRKVSVSGTDGEAEFQGIHVSFNPNTLQSNSFHLIAAKSSVEVTFDIAQLYDLSAGGDFNVQSKGMLQYVQHDGDYTKLGNIQLQSNTITAKIDGKQAAAANSVLHEYIRRATITSSCNGNKDVIQTLSNKTYEIAIAARDAARSAPNSKIDEYFKKSDKNTRDILYQAFSNMAKYYASSTGNPSLSCTASGPCSKGAAGYTITGNSTVFYCDALFEVLPVENTTCRSRDCIQTAVHEATHLKEIKGTDDYGTYLWENCQKLPAEKNINHADTYSYFARDMYYETCP